MSAGTTVARINTLVTANTTQFTRAMGKAQTRAGKFKAAAGLAAKAASGPLALGLIGVAGAAVKMATGFDDSMSKIESLVGLAGSEVDAMKDSVLGLAGQTARAPAELADAMFFIQSAGLRGSAAVDTLEASAKAAAVGLGDTATIADLATSALNAYGEENLSATSATDVMVAAVREGKLEASELAGSMGRVLPIASAMGVRFDEVGAAFAALSRTGTNAAEAATQVRGIMSSLLRPTKQAEEALSGMGLSSEGLRTQLKEKGLLSTLQTLSDKFDGNDAAAASVFGNIRALSGVMDLMGENVATTEQIFANMTDTTGTLDQAFAVASDTAGFKFQKAMADVKKALIDIGQKVLPIVMTMLEGARSMVSAFAAMPKPIKLAAAALVALVVASGPIGALALAVGGLMFAFGKMGEEGRNATNRQEQLTAEFAAANDPATTLIDRMREMADAIEDVGDNADDATNPIGSFTGSNLALGMALEDELMPLFNDLGISMDDVARAAEGGSDEFQNMEKRFTRVGDSGEDLRANFDQLTEAELKVAEALVDARIAGQITEDQFDSMLNVVDETADAFDDHRKAVEADAEAFMKSTDAAKLLNNANLDAEKILGDLTKSGKSYAEQAQVIHQLTDDVTGSMDRMTFEAQTASQSVDNLADATDAATEDTDLLGEAFGEAADEAEKLRISFEDLMGAMLSDVEAINNAELLIESFDDAILSLTDDQGKLQFSTAEMRQQLIDMSNDSAAALDDLFESGHKIGGPEMISSALAFTEKLDEMQEFAHLNTEEFEAMREALLEMAGLNIPVTISVNSNVPTSVAGFNPVVRQGDRFFGATGGIVTQPTMAMIGEAGPEAVVPLNRAPGASALPSGFGGGGDTHITVNMSAGADGDSVVRALQDYARRRGSIPVPVGTARY